MIPKKLNKKKIIFIFGSVVFIILIFFFFYKFGFLRYYELKSQVKELKTEIDSVDKQNANLNAEIDSLRTMDSKIEKVAREKFNMVRKGEKVFKVVGK
ncbi:MAG: septum formation initiator family protein [Bacteroidota bacterium]|nr:septum formation initiator family protein [Bacteroidota bacterium]MDP4191026.1 septum formation initiator family protein [Bacteroidota bacterium]MDP4196220.1 septum formation initiator family protein [Bacteroidota bacterium]